MRDFRTYRSADRDRVEPFAERQRSAGFEPWIDCWAISGGDDFVVRLNDGLATCDAALVFVSAASDVTRSSRMAGNSRSRSSSTWRHGHGPASSLDRVGPTRQCHRPRSGLCGGGRLKTSTQIPQHQPAENRG